MKKMVLLGALVALALGLAPAHAAPAEGSYCLIAGVAQTAGDGVQKCQFTAEDVPAHGFVGAVPNDFVIFIDGNGNQSPDDGEQILADVSPSGGGTPAGQFDVAAGTVVTVNLFEGCAGPACGWVGALLVG